MLVTSMFSPHAVVPLCHTQKMTGTTATPTFRGQIVPLVPASLLVPGQKPSTRAWVGPARRREFSKYGERAQEGLR